MANCVGVGIGERRKPIAEIAEGRRYAEIHAPPALRAAWNERQRKHKRHMIRQAFVFALSLVPSQRPKAAGAMQQPLRVSAPLRSRRSVSGVSKAI